jgi:SET domain
VETLEKFGRCLENISHGPSALNQAGRGAFATCSFPAGALITGSPLIHVKTAGALQIYQEVYASLIQDKAPSQQGTWPNNSFVRTFQIAINYCWKHPESQMLLCPYGAGVNFINHNQTLANVRVKWAPHGEAGHDSSVFDQSLETLFRMRKTRLAFDFIATRDIKEGEELFLDYGEDWERAWLRHTDKFRTDHSSPTSMVDPLYQSARQWNHANDESDIRTEAEQVLNLYPSHMELRCHQQSIDVTPSSAVSAIRRSYKWTMRDIGVRCHVLERSTINSTSWYTVCLDDDDHRSRVCERTRLVPRRALRFIDRPYTTDLHLKEAFRYPIGIPDELFPSAWKSG